MSRVDWIVLRRLGYSMGLTALVFFGLIVLIELMNISRFNALTAAAGLPVAIQGLLIAGVRWVVVILPFVVLIGCCIGLISLQTTREMTVIKASGLSIWRVMRAPLAAVLLLGLGATLFADSLTLEATRKLDNLVSKQRGNVTAEPLWLEELKSEPHYVLEAEFVQADGRALAAVTVFMLDAPRDRLEAETGELADGEWLLRGVTRLRSGQPPEKLAEFRLPTSSRPGDLRVQMSTIGKLTLFELGSLLASQVTDPALQRATLTRFFKLLGLPLALAGSLVIAFAFTAGYRRTNKYEATVLYGIVLGFVVYVVTEMAGRAGDAGVLDPGFAAFGPSVVAIIIGTTVLLNKEDGRT